MSQLHLGQSKSPENYADARTAVLGRLGEFAKRNHLLQVIGRLMLGVGGLSGFVILLILADAIFDLSAPWRTAGLLLFIAMSLLAIRWLFRFKRHRDAIERTGQAIDRYSSGPASPISIGLTLGADDQEQDAIRHSLMLRALERAKQAAMSVRPCEVYPKDKLAKPGSCLWWCVLVWIAIGLLFPGLLPTGAARIAMPWRDIPAYNLTSLSVSWSPQSPEAGNNVTLHAIPAGLDPEGVKVVLLNENGQERSRLPMSRTSEGAFSLELRQVREPIRFRLLVNDRQTKFFEIIPTKSPVDESNSPEASATENGESDLDQGGVLKQSNKTQAWLASVRDLLDKVSELREQLDAAEPNDATQIEELKDAIASVLNQAKALGEQMDKGSATALSKQLQALVDDLNQLSLAQLPPGPESSPGAQPAGEPQTPVQDWLEQAREAAESDEQALRAGLGEVESLSDSGQSNLGGSDRSGTPDATADGLYSTEQPEADQGILPPDTLERIPPRYREHIAEYFRQLAEQEDDR